MLRSVDEEADHGTQRHLGESTCRETGYFASRQLIYGELILLCKTVASLHRLWDVL